MRCIMLRPNYLQSTKKKIEKAPFGSVFVASDLAEIAETKRINECLGQLAKENIIQRILRGVCYKPEFSELLGEYTAPSPDAVAQAIARNFGWTINPCGDTALNILGLSTQVPAVWSYVSDGPYKTYSFGKTTLTFKHITNKEITRLSPQTALVIQALKALGKENVTFQIKSRIKAITSDSEKQTMLAEAKYATTWIYEIIKDIFR